MSKTARIAVMLLAVAPAWEVGAIDPTLPQPGRTKPAARPVSPAGVSPGSATTAAADPAAPVVADPTPVEAATAGRQPVPDAAALTDAQKLVDQVYRDELAAARTPELKKQLAAKFRQLASASQPAGKYVLLLRAREMAADAGDPATALGAVADLERAFDTDGGPLELDAVGRLQRVLRSPDALAAITRHLLGSANQAVANDRFDSARRLIDQAAAISGRINEPPMVRLVAARAREVREVEAAFLQAAPALEAVAKGSADPAQQLAAGRYRALYKGDFPAGLPLLAAGAEDPLKVVAARELAGVSGAEQQDALADAWYAIAEKLTGVARNHTVLHSAGFYGQAAPSLVGLQQAKAAKRVKEAEPLAAMYVGRPASAGGASAVASAAPATASPPIGATPSPGTSSQPAPSTVPPAVNVNLPPKFVRLWKTPEVWTNKPEDVTLKSGRVTITNAGGTVCENEPLLPQKDGTLVLAWDYGPDKTGYEVWSIKDGELQIHRWNSKAEIDARPVPRRVGSIAK